MISKQFDPQAEKSYFETIGERSEINRCIFCDVGMEIESVYERRCPKCNHSDASNVPLKLKVKFVVYQQVGVKEAMVICTDTKTNKVSYTRLFVDKTAADRYVDSLKPICL